MGEKKGGMLGKFLDARYARYAQIPPNKKDEARLENLQYGKREQKQRTQTRTETNVGVGRNSETLLPYFLRKNNFHLLGKDKLSALDW